MEIKIPPAIEATTEYDYDMDTRILTYTPVIVWDGEVVWEGPKQQSEGHKYSGVLAEERAVDIARQHMIECLKKVFA